MDTLPKKIERTGDALRRQSATLLGRTAQAGRAFAGETVDATRIFARFVDREARGWAGYAATRRKRAVTGVRELFMPRALERQALARMQHALAGLHARVEHRLAALEPKPRRASKKR